MSIPVQLFDALLHSGLLSEDDDDDPDYTDDTTEMPIVNVDVDEERERYREDPSEEMPVVVGTRTVECELD